MTFPHQSQHSAAAANAAAAAARNRRRLTIILSAIVAILAVVLAFTVAKIVSDKTGKSIIPGLTLQASNEAGPDPFTPATSSPATETQQVSFRLAGSTAGDQEALAVNGSEPGLYGVYSSQSCDVSALARYLANNTQAANAWASVFGISTNAIPWYLNTLTPVVLTTDTRVTNHAYTDGAAVPFQAVLQAGTPVLVDGAGVPRVRCACGNPLAPPAARPISDYQSRGSQWRGYDQHRVVHVVTADKKVVSDNGVRKVVERTPADQAPVTQVLQVVNLTQPSTAPVGSTPVGGFNTYNATGPKPASIDVPSPLELNTTPIGPATGDEDADGPATSATDSTTTGAATSTASESNSTSTAPASESKAAEPTTLNGDGDAVGAFSFTDGDTTVTCTLPSTFDTAAASATCDDSRILSLAPDQLLRDAVTTAIDGNEHKQWILQPQATAADPSPSPITVSTLTWQTLSTPSTSESTETTTTEAPAETSPETSDQNPPTSAESESSPEQSTAESTPTA